MAKAKQTTKTKVESSPSPVETRRDRRAAQVLTPKASNQMPFDRLNYLLLAGCVGLIAIGYIIMRMDNQVDGFVSLYVSPIILLAGYLGVIYAIMKRPHRENV